MGPSDHELIARVRAGDADAFTTLFARHQAAVRRHVERIVRDGGAAEDLAQEVFVRVWTQAEQWQGRGPIAAWLFRIATNLALNHLRALRRRPQQSLDGPGAWPDADREPPVPGWLIDAAALGPDALLEQAEQSLLLRRLIARLPAEKRTVFYLVHEADLTIRSVAALLGVPEGTVKSRLHYATKHLASAWQAVAAPWEEDA